MIIDSKQGDIEVVGDIKEFKTSIDPKNLEFITTLLSSNLYSDPEQSFIREIVSNAWDSHVEAEATDLPVIIKFAKGSDGNSVTIRDYGVGLSPERFLEVYCNIGSSTKRESNDFIGGFGIGKYSSLACSNTVYITSYYEGIAYYYVMAKSGNSIITNLLLEKPTSEKNGVEVTIKNIPDLTPFNKALQYIVFFPNIYINGAENAEVINRAKLKRFKNFAAVYMQKPYTYPKAVPSKLLLGNVLYKCDKYHLCQEAKDFLSSIEDTGIVIQFEVGEINITPNRESIIYNADTIKKIENRIAAARDELEELISKKLTKDYDNIEEYFNAVSGSKYYEPVTGEFIDYYGYKIKPTDLKNCTITFNGLDLKEDINSIRDIFGMTLPNFKGYIDDGRIMVQNIYRITNSKLKGTKLLMLNKGAILRASVKSFLKDNYNGYGVMTGLDESEFRDYVCRGLGPIEYPSSDNFDLIVSAIYQSLNKKAKTLDLETDSDYLAYKQKIAEGKILNPAKDREIILYEWDTRRGFKNKRNFKRFNQAVSYIKGLKNGIILTGMDADELMFRTLANLKGYAFIQARKDIVADLNKLNLKCMVDTNWLLNKDPMLKVVNTIAKHFPSGMILDEVNAVNYNLPSEEAVEFSRLYNICKKYEENSIYYSIVRIKDRGIDPYTEYLCLKLKNYIRKHKKAKSLIVGSGCENNSDIVSAVVMKSKAYRISNKAYSRVKNNKLIKVLCRKF